VLASTVAGSQPRSTGLPELASVYWRPRATQRSLRRTGRLWTLSTISQTVPFVITAVLLGALKPITLPVGLILLAHAWIIPELYAARGANVVTPRGAGAPAAEERAMLLLGDLIGHQARELYARTGLVQERGELGVWLLGEAGALLLPPAGRRVYCLCVKATDPKLPVADRVAHLLLALRSDESGFATLANLAFSGARWRLRRRLRAPAREALDHVVTTTRANRGAASRGA
jgi:hypothetical protein